MSKPLGLKVTVTGLKMREEGMSKEKKAAAGGESANLRVTHLKHVVKPASDSIQRGL
jgi:hypothetical protein